MTASAKHSAVTQILAFDYGQRRIGVATGNSVTGTATPLTTLTTRGKEPNWDQIDQLVREWQPQQLIVGNPNNGQSIASEAKTFAAALRRRYEKPVDMVDETLTSFAAEQELIETRRAGVRTRRLKSDELDAAAARLIAEQWLAEPRRGPKEEPLPLRHLLTLEELDRAAIDRLLDRSRSYLCLPGQLPPRDDALKGITVANLFFEPSTRTRASFELAAKRLSADVLNLDVKMSSRAKGESILDTIYTLQAMLADIFVVRDASDGVTKLVADHVAPHVCVLNAGESQLAHPTQGLLDLLTIQRHKPAFEKLVVVIVGDIEHSRVARSAVTGLTTMGVGEIRLVGPADLLPQDGFANAKRFEDLDAGLEGADVVMALRIQRERFGQVSGIPDPQEYFRQYGLSEERLRVAKPDAIVMHPGPMNRGVEIAGTVADGPQSVIQEQVSNGIAVRMAVLATAAEHVAAHRTASRS